MPTTWWRQQKWLNKGKLSQIYCTFRFCHHEGGLTKNMISQTSILFAFFVHIYVGGIQVPVKVGELTFFNVCNNLVSFEITPHWRSSLNKLGPRVVYSCYKCWFNLRHQVISFLDIKKKRGKRTVPGRKFRKTAGSNFCALFASNLCDADVTYGHK